MDAEKLAADQITTDRPAVDEVSQSRSPEWEVLKKVNFSFNTKVKLGDFFEQKPGEKVKESSFALSPSLIGCSVCRLSNMVVVHIADRYGA